MNTPNEIDRTNGAPVEPVCSADCHDRLWDLIFDNPSIFGRLAMVSEQYDPDTGMYRHHLAAEMGAPAVDEALRRMHGEVFRSWLALGVERQERDLSIWLAWLDRTGEASSKRLREIALRVAELLPTEHRDAERQLFVDDFRLVVGQVLPFAVVPSKSAGRAGSGLRRQAHLGSRNRAKKRRG